MSADSPRRILVASLAGTAIEFFDFYIYATAAVLVFPKQFFPRSDPTSATLQSLAIFAVAFFARPVGSALFGHFGDRIGRKATLVAALLTMGVSTVAIGILPTYSRIGIAAPILLTLCRIGQGLGLGGEWGGAILLATENAPPSRRAWYGMFPQLGAPVGYLFSGTLFLVLSATMSDAAFMDYGWRIPFLCSSALVLMGLYVRLKIAETPVFQKAVARQERVAVPMMTVMRSHPGVLALGTVLGMATFVIFYTLTVFCLSWGTTKLGYSRDKLLLAQLVGNVFFAATIPLSAWLADRHGRRFTMIFVTLGIIAFGLLMGPLFSAGMMGALATMVIGLSLMGLSYSPLGTLLSELFPTAVRYSGTAVAYSLAGILGGSLVPSVATWLAAHFGLPAVGWYMSGCGVLSLAALAMTRETRETQF